MTSSDASQRNVKCSDMTQSPDNMTSFWTVKREKLSYGQQYGFTRTTEPRQKNSETPGKSSISVQTVPDTGKQKASSTEPPKRQNSPMWSSQITSSSSPWTWIQLQKQKTSLTSAWKVYLNTPRKCSTSTLPPIWPNFMRSCKSVTT